MSYAKAIKGLTRLGIKFKKGTELLANNVRGNTIEYTRNGKQYYQLYDASGQLCWYNIFAKDKETMAGIARLNDRLMLSKTTVINKATHIKDTSGNKKLIERTRTTVHNDDINSSVIRENFIDGQTSVKKINPFEFHKKK